MEKKIQYSFLQIKQQNANYQETNSKNASLGRPSKDFQAAFYSIRVWDFSNQDKTSLFVMVEHIDTGIWNQVCIVIQYSDRVLQLLYHACVVISTYCYITLLNQNPM